MFDYLFKGLITVNHKNDNSTKRQIIQPTHSYDTTFLVVVVIIGLLIVILWMVYKALLAKAMRGNLAPRFVYLPEVGKPLHPHSVEGMQRVYGPPVV